MNYTILLFAELSKADRDEKSVERKEKDRKTIRRKKISSLKRQISIREKQLEVTFPLPIEIEILTRLIFFTPSIFNTIGLSIKSKSFRYATTCVCVLNSKCSVFAA